MFSFQYVLGGFFKHCSVHSNYSVSCENILVQISQDVRIGLTAIKARIFKQSIPDFRYTLLGFWASALLVFR